MATQTLTRLETDRLYAMRVMINESDPEGDFWRFVKASSSIADGLYNTWCDWFNDISDFVDDENNTLNGTNATGGTFAIGGMPSRPRPTQRP